MDVPTVRLQRDTRSSLLIAAFPEKGCLMFANCFTFGNCCEKSPQESRFKKNILRKVIMGSPACGWDVLAEYRLFKHGNGDK